MALGAETENTVENGAPCELKQNAGDAVKTTNGQVDNTILKKGEPVCNCNRDNYYKVCYVTCVSGCSKGAPLALRGLRRKFNRDLLLWFGGFAKAVKSGLKFERFDITSIFVLLRH